MFAGEIWVQITQEASRGAKLGTHALCVGYKVGPAEEIARKTGVVAWRDVQCRDHCEHCSLPPPSDFGRYQGTRPWISTIATSYSGRGYTSLNIIMNE